MLRLDLSSEPKWIDLILGVRIKVMPLNSAMMMSARQALNSNLLENGASQDLIALEMAKSVARIAIVEWDGFGDELGNAVPVTPENVNALIEIWPIFEAFQSKYVAKHMLLEQEKNEFAPSLNGTTVTAQNIVQGAPKSAKPARHK